MAGQKVDDIRVGLGLSLGQLESDASAAKAKLAELEKPREVPISIKVRLTGKEGEEAATKIKQNIQTALDSLKKSGTFDITPKLTRNTISDMKKAIREELRAHPVEIPVAVKMTQADGTRIRRDIEAGIGVVKIGFDYYWVNGPPDLGGSGGPSHGGPQGGGGHGGGGRPPAGAGTSGPAAPSTPPSSGSGPRAQRSAANKAAHAAQRSPSQAASDAKARGQQPPPPASQATQQPPSSPPPSSGGRDARGRFTSRSAAPQAAPPAQQPAAQEPTVNRGTRTRSAPRRASTPGTVAATPPAATSASSVAEAVTSSVMSGGSRGPAPEPNVRGRASRRNGYRTGGAPRGFGDPGEPMEPAAVRRRDRNQQIAEDRAAQQRADQEADRRVGVFPQHSAVKNALRNFESDPLELVAIAPHAAAALLNYEQDPVTAGQKTRATEPTLGSRRHGGRRSLRRRVGKARAGKLKLDRYDEQGRYLGPVDDVALLTAASMEAVGTESALARDPNAILKIGAGKKGGTRRSRRPKNVATPEAVRKQIAKGITADVQTPSLIEALNAAQREGMTVEEVIDSMKSQDPTLAAAGVMALDPTIQPQRREDTRRKVTKVKEESDRSPLPENRPGSPPVGTPVSLDAQLVAAEEARARAAAADARDAKSRSEADAKERTKKQAEAAAEAAAKKAEKIASYERAWSAIPEETRRRLLQDPNRDQFFQSRYGDWRPPAFAGGGYYRVYRAGMIDAPGKGGSFLRKLGNQGDFGLAVSGMTPSDRLRRVLDGEEIGSAWVSHDTDSVQRYLRRETHTDNRTHRWWREKGQHLGLPEDQAADIGRKMTARTAARTMIHEGSILSSQWGKAIGPGDGSPGELEVANPKYLINHLAGPKGPLPRAGGGPVWYRGGTTAYKNLWVPGSGRQHPMAEGPMSTLGAGLYLTDEDHAWQYARYRAGHRGGGDPIVGRARVTAKNILELDDRGNLPPAIAGAWGDRLREMRRNGEFKASSDWLLRALYSRSLEGLEKGYGGTGRNNAYAGIGSFQRPFTAFLQGKGFHALKGMEGGEGSVSDHPSMVVFDPKRHVRPFANGGITFRRTEPTPLTVDDLADSLPFGAIDLTGFHPKNAQAVLESLQGLSQRFPFTARHILGVGSAPTEWFDQMLQPQNRTSNRPGVPYGVTLPAGSGMSSIMLNSSVFSNPDMGKNAKILLRADPAAIVAHEFGHAWDAANAWAPSGTLATSGLKPVSEYAKHNSHEGLAELFTKAWSKDHDLTEAEWRLMMTGGFKFANGGAVRPGGLLARMLGAGLTTAEERLMMDSGFKFANGGLVRMRKAALRGLRKGAFRPDLGGPRFPGVGVTLREDAEGFLPDDGGPRFPGVGVTIDGRKYAEGGLLARLLAATTTGTTITPGMEARSAELNALLGIARGGTSESGGAMLPSSTPAPMSAAADRRLRFLQGKAEGGWVPGFGRGGAYTMYHGTKGRPFREFDPRRFRTESLFGPGAYLTNDKDLAKSYTGDSRLGTILKAKVRAGTRTLDVENPRHHRMLEHEMAQVVDFIDPGRGPLFREYARGIMEDAELSGRPELKPYRMYEAFADVASDLSAATQLGERTIHEELQHRLRKKGYAGFSHWGGTYLGGKKHKVNVLWDTDRLEPLKKAPKDPRRAKFLFGQEKMMWEYLEDLEGELPFMGGMNPGSQADLQARVAFLRDMKAKGAMWTTATLHEGKPRDGRPYLAGAGVWHDVQGNVFSDGSALDRTVGRSTFSSDDRTEAKHLKYLKGVFQRRGFKFAGGGATSPWVRRAMAGQLPASDRTGAIMARQHAPHWASGQLPPLADHPGAILAGERGPEPYSTPLGVTMLGQHGPEVVVPRVGGFVVANHKQGGSRLADRWRQLALRRMDEMERRAGGGPINPGGPNAPTLRFRLGNRFASQAQASAAAVQAGTAAIYNAPAPMRVIVLNWPASLTQPAPSAAPGGGGQPQPGVQTRQPRNRQQANTVVTPNTPPGPGGPGAPGVPPPGSGGSPRATPLQQQRSFNTSLSSLDALRNRLQQVRIGTSDALQLTPVRALSVSVGQQFQELFGGRRDIRERARVATYEADRASRFAAQQESRNRAFEDQRAVLAEMKANPTKYTAQQYTDARDKFLKLRQARDLAVRQTEAATLRSEIVLKGEDKLVKEKPGQEQEIRQLAGQLRQENQNVKAPTGGVLQRGNVLKAQALGVAGIVGGTVLFSAAMGAAQAGLMALSKVVGNAAESLMGFASTTTRVTGELAGAVQGQGNLAGAGLSTKFAQLGIDSSKLGNVRQASIAQAGAQNLQGQIDLLRSERNLGQRDMTKLGTFQGFGNGPLAGVPGLGWIGQTPGAIEQLVNNLKTPATEENVNNLVRTGVFTTEPSKATTDLQRFIDDQVRSAQYSINALSNQFSGRTANITGMTAEQARAANAPFIAQTNQNATKGGFKGSLVALSGPELEASTTALKAVGPEAAGLAEQLHSLGMGLKTAAGTMPTADEWKSYWQSAVQGANAPSIPEMITAMRPQLTAQARSIQRNRAFTEQTQIPVQFGAQLLANPLSANPSQGITATSNQLGSQYAGQPAAMDQGQLSDYIAQIGETRDDLDALRDKGIQTMLDLGVPQETIDSVGKLGGQIRDLSDSAESLQLGYQTAQYNRQLYLAKRALSDIIGLQGKSSAATAAGTVNASKMGELQRAQLQDERELARIQIARSRREIEFNLALSRLSTPGATAEERATRRAEAEAIAREQKKELNIQERSTLRGFRIQDIGISRDARDAIFAIKDLQAQQGLAIQLRGIEKLIEAKQQMLQVRQAYLDTAIEAGISLKRLANDAQGQIEAATGDFTDTYKGELETVFDLIVKDSVKAYNDFIKQTGAPSLSPDQGGDTPQNHGNYATGTPGFRVSSPTRFTAGEAGSEEVIVLRNPRSGMTTAMSPAWDGSGGAPVMLTVNMNGMVVRSNQDIDEIVRRVERLLNEKAAMMGAFGRS